MSLTGDASKARVIAFFIDNLVACLIAFLTVGALHSGSGVLSGTVLCVAYLAYFFLFELLWRRTPGKFMQGLVVVSADGNRAGLKAHLIRTLARLFEANPFLLGGIPAGIAILSSDRKQRVGDSIAGTVVVSKRVLR